MPTRPVHFWRFLMVPLAALAVSVIPAFANTNGASDANGVTVRERGRLPLNDLRAFTEVLQRIKSAYVEPIDDKTLLENAIRGMLDNLDPHSAYLQQEDFKTLEESTSGEFGGLGVEISSENGQLTVISPIDNSPAQKAGVRAGDVIVKLNDSPVRELDVRKSVDMMRGKVGEPIKLTIMRKGSTKPINITVVRDIVRVESVRHHMLDDKLGYIRISQFQNDTGKEVESALKTMYSKGGLGGIILDLRNNPGGVLQSSVDVADLFINSGRIVYTQGRLADANIQYMAKPTVGPYGTMPVVVMINGGSASASEIVAGALQDHNRGIVVGTKSFGKGSVQTVYPLNTDSDRGLKLTTALYYTPNGRSIQAEGILPDIVIDDLSVTKVQENIDYREADLQNHLEKTLSAGTKKPTTAAKNNKSTSTESLEVADYQLQQATNILKSLYLSKRGVPRAAALNK